MRKGEKEQLIRRLDFPQLRGTALNTVLAMCPLKENTFSWIFLDLIALLSIFLIYTYSLSTVQIISGAQNPSTLGGKVGQEIISEEITFKPYTGHKRLPARELRSPAAIKNTLLAKAGPYLPIIRDAAAINHVRKSLILAVIKVESRFDPRAVSPKGAIGLMQLMPKTAKDLGVKTPFDPEQNIHGGVRYLSYCLSTFKDMKLALAAYNAGPGLIAKLKEIPPYKETQNFVKNVLQYKMLYDSIIE